MFVRNFCLVVGIAILAAGAEPAFAEETDATPESETVVVVSYEIEDGAVFVVQGEEREKLQLPGRAEFLLVVGDEMCVVIGDSGVIVYGLEDRARPRPSRTVAPPFGRITGLHETGGRVWMQISSLTAMPLSSIHGKVPEIEVKPAPVEKVPVPEISEEEKPEEAIRILSIKDGRVELSSGSDRSLWDWPGPRRGTSSPSAERGYGEHGRWNPTELHTTRKSRSPAR